MEMERAMCMQKVVKIFVKLVAGFKAFVGLS